MLGTWSESSSSDFLEHQGPDKVMPKSMAKQVEPQRLSGIDQRLDTLGVHGPYRGLRPICLIGIVTGCGVWPECYGSFGGVQEKSAFVVGAPMVRIIAC